MNYIENVFVCLAAPLLVAAICMNDKGRRATVFLLAGMTACLLSSYISTFVASTKGMSYMSASVEVSPLVEEVMKFLPFLFYLLVFEPKRDELTDEVIMISIGFATFENACYLATNGADRVLFLTIRGFGTGAMHVVCGFLIAAGLLFLWDRIWLQIAGTIGLLAISMTYHGIYNVLVSQTGPVAHIGYLIPLLTAALSLGFLRKHLRQLD
jgi:RsiW-degrading membrane proteinase PrsW (M82 family)